MEMDLDINDQLLIRYSAFVKYCLKSGNFTKEYDGVTKIGTIFSVRLIYT
jgi:hypothetical protein